VSKIDEAMRDIKMLCDFAYERGFHELGYNPVAEVQTFIGIAIQELLVVQREIDVPSQALLLLGKEYS
jgi:hypothetical protein